MGPFALPVPAYRLGIHTRKRRERNDENNASLSPEPDTDIASTHVSSDSINPRSHSPDTLRQFATAGLSPEDEVPSKTYPLFPHKPLPPEYPAGGGGGRRSRRRNRRMSSAGGDGAESEVEARTADDRAAGLETTVKQHAARLKHLNTLTAVMHRCLNDGDVPRAKRAFGLLLRTKDVDIRLKNLWAVGSEILMRDGETEEGRRRQATDQDQDPFAAAGGDTGEGQQSALPHRWGSAANIDTVRKYFESLIQQYPYDPHRPNLTSAIDFWPALFGIEIYNLDTEFRRALCRVKTELEDEGEEEMAFSDEYLEARRQQREESRQEMAWAARDELRQETQIVVEQIATRMDQVLENPPYSTHQELLRLRGNVSLFIADLYLPSRIVDRSNVIEDRMEELSLSDNNLLLAQADGPEERDALGKREEEKEKARFFFREILQNGGEVDAWILKFMDMEDEHDTSLRDEPSIS
ncbi:hypothetical protein F4779DRAFT_476882 [Xylariaceae sp. FL0662B]|nr:hypothetical protein F4779DRAFT_476882 [Xylariaceae sp. FL0662B]